MRVVLAVLGLAVASHTAHADCAIARYGSTVLTPAGAKLVIDGGVLVESQVFHDANPSGAPDANNPTWRFRAGAKDYTPTLVALAPGLVVYRPPAGVVGPLTLADGTRELGTLTITADSAGPLAPPQPQSVKLRTISLAYHGTALRLDATFKAAAPAGAVAVVVHGSTKTGTAPRSWMRVKPGTKTLAIGGTAGRCDPGIPGEIVSKVGDKIVLAWVDAHGRLSPFSKPITVQRGK